MIKENLSLYSCHGQETFGIQSELNLSSSHSFVFHNLLHINHLTAAMRNYLLVQKKIGNTNSAHARLKVILDN